MKRILILLFFFLFSFLTQIEAKELQLSEDEAKLLSEYSKRKIGEDPISKKYLIDILYVGMPEEEFVKYFTWDESFEGTVKPHIMKHVKDVYYIRVPFAKILNRALGLVSRETEKITFKERKLVKYETQCRPDPPFTFLLVYHDITSSLEGYQYSDGLYKGIPEEDFLKKFKDKIHRDSDYKNHWYYVTVASNLVYRVIFENGKLDYVRKEYK